MNGRGLTKIGAGHYLDFDPDDGQLRNGIVEAQQGVGTRHTVNQDRPCP